ncbi:hypothetical protein ASZ90_009746 [hydrocarbon metagenome]|uniref:Uncharacterized protein n=1 Tax=hydrocarbon metagenome TaxID=938273 RepID=A0A0W8FI13_9ZZZZ
MIAEAGTHSSPAGYGRSLPDAMPEEGAVREEGLDQKMRNRESCQRWHPMTIL